MKFLCLKSIIYYHFLRCGVQVIVKCAAFQNKLATLFDACFLLPSPKTVPKLYYDANNIRISNLRCITIYEAHACLMTSIFLTYPSIRNVPHKRHNLSLSKLFQSVYDHKLQTTFRRTSDQTDFPQLYNIYIDKIIFNIPIDL